MAYDRGSPLEEVFQVNDDPLSRMVEEALEEELTNIRDRIHAVADRILEQRLAEMGFADDYIDRYEASKEFDIPVWRIRDWQLRGRLPVVRRGKKAYVSRSALAQYLQEHVT